MNALSRYASLAAMIGCLAGCGKEKVVSTVPTTPPTGSVPAPAAAVTPGSAAINASLSHVDQQIQEKNYSAATDLLIQRQQSAKMLSDAERARHEQQILTTTDALLRSQDTDPQAKAAYERLSRSMTGR